MSSSPPPSPPLLNFRSLTTPPPFPSSTKTHTSSPILLPLLYRSASPSSLTPSTIRILTSLPYSITTIYDLRSVPELTRSPVPTRLFPPTLTYQHSPVFAEKDYAPPALARRFASYAAQDGREGFRRAYGEILEAGGKGGAFGTVLRGLAVARDEEGGGGRGGVLVCCSAGKDRTGVLVAVALGLCGWDDGDVAREYALSEDGLGEEWKTEAVERVVGYLGGDRVGAGRMVGARAENMLATLEMMRERYGGAERYVKEVCGLRDEEIRRIRENLLAGGGEA